MAKNTSKSNATAKITHRIAPIERIQTGTPGLDKLIQGGFVRNSTILLRGDTGTGKTIFSLQYLYYGAVNYDEPGMYISFSEPVETIKQHGISFGWDMDKLEDEHKLVITKQEPHEVVNRLSQGGGSLRDVVESIGAKRLVIDSLTAYEMVFENKYKANESVLELFEFLRKWNSTAVVTSEFPVTPQHESGGRLGFLTDGIINFYHIRQNAHRVRALEIIKMRDTAHKDEIYVFDIGNGGLKLTGQVKVTRGEKK